MGFYSLMQKTDKICNLYFAILKNAAFFQNKICIFQKIVVILQRQKKYKQLKFEEYETYKESNARRDFQRNEREPKGARN